MHIVPQPPPLSPRHSKGHTHPFAFGDGSPLDLLRCAVLACAAYHSYTNLPAMDSPANAPLLLSRLGHDPFVGFSFRESAYERGLNPSS